MPKNMNIRPTNRPARPIIIRSKWKWLDNGLSIAKTAKHSIYDTLSVKCPHHVICHLGKPGGHFSQKTLPSTVISQIPFGPAEY